MSGAALAVLLFGSEGEEGPAGPPTSVVMDRGEPNGRPATSEARLSAWWPSRGRRERELVTRWQEEGRAVVAGRLTTATRGPIAGARISVLAADASDPGQGSRTVGEVRTDRHGRFATAIALDRGTARKLLTFAYLARSRDEVPAATAQAGLDVTGAVSLDARTRTTRRGGSVPVYGRSPAGAAVQVLVRQPGLKSWRIWSSARASGTGRWESAVYIPSYGPRGSYLLRARVLGDGRRGFLPAESKPTRIEVR